MGDYNHQQMSNQHHQQLQQKQYVSQQHHPQQHMQQQQQHYHQNIQQRTVPQMAQGQRPPIRPHMNTPQQQNNPSMQTRINTPMQNQQGYRQISMQQQSSQSHQGTPQQIRQINQSQQIGQGGTVYVAQNPNNQQRIIHRQIPQGTVMRTVQTSSQYTNNQQMSGTPQQPQQQQTHYIYSSNESPNRPTQGNQRVIHQQVSNNQTGVSALRQALGHPSGPQNAHQGPTLVQYSTNPQPPQHPSQPPTPQQQMTIRSHTPQPQIKIEQQSPQQPRSNIVVTSPPSITSPYNNIVNSQQRMTPLMGQGRISPVEPPIVVQKETPKQMTPAPPPQPENYDNVPIMTKGGLKDFVKTIDETDIVEEDVLEHLIETSNELLENVLEKAKKLAIHRGGNKIEARDIELVLKKFYDMDVPPYIAGVYLTQ
uniref:Transcription initiation factor TFIID subunit 12 n=1 Tax=Strongyloides venezuelensis TaxID=75913 RepID=A0A0K0F1Y8_STRVS